MLKVLLIDGAEIRSLWYMHRAGLSDRRWWKGAALSKWQEHYQSIFHRCQRGLVPVSSSGCHLLNEGMKGMFKVEIQACLDRGLCIVTGWKIAFEPQIPKSRLQGVSLMYCPNSCSWSRLLHVTRKVSAQTTEPRPRRHQNLCPSASYLNNFHWNCCSWRIRLLCIFKNMTHLCAAGELYCVCSTSNQLALLTFCWKGQRCSPYLLHPVRFSK